MRATPRLFLSTALLLAACGGSSSGSAPGLAVSINLSSAGFVSATTALGASCLTAQLPSGQFVSGGQLGTTQIANTRGGVSWTYTLSTKEKGTGTHTVTCSLGAQTRSSSAPFPLP